MYEWYETGTLLLNGLEGELAFESTEYCAIIKKEIRVSN